MSETEEPAPLGEPEEADDVLPAESAPEEKPAATAVTGTLPDASGGERVAPPGPTAPAGPSASGRAARPDLTDRRDPLYREIRGYKLRLDPPDLARLRELPGSRGKSDTEIGEAFFDGQAERLLAAVAGDVPDAAELRVVVDPYSRQAFLALEGTVRGILSF